MSFPYRAVEENWKHRLSQIFPLKSQMFIVIDFPFFPEFLTFFHLSGRFVPSTQPRLADLAPPSGTTLAPKVGPDFDARRVRAGAQGAHLSFALLNGDDDWIWGSLGPRSMAIIKSMNFCPHTIFGSFQHFKNGNLKRLPLSQTIVFERNVNICQPRFRSRRPFCEVALLQLNQQSSKRALQMIVSYGK